MATSPPSSSFPQNPTTYTPPNTGIFSLLPRSWIPYAELMRLDRPDGFYAFYWHYAIGLGFAACVSLPPQPPIHLVYTAIHLALFVLLLRGITCTWNDNLDQEFDRRVSRTKFRPIARGAVSTKKAHIFTGVQLLIGAVVLLPLPEESVLYAAGITAVLMIYPLGKRFTDFPQVILGIGFAMPVFMCCAVLGVGFGGPDKGSSSLDLELDSIGMGEGAEGGNNTLSAALCLFLALLLWTIIFDTVYAHQDAKEDVKAGVRSLAVLLGERTKLALSVLTATQIGLLGAVGVICEFSAMYVVVGCGGAGVVLASMIKLVELHRPESCAWWFGPGSKLVGVSLVAGLWGEYWVSS